MYQSNLRDNQQEIISLVLLRKKESEKKIRTSIHQLCIKHHTSLNAYFIKFPIISRHCAFPQPQCMKLKKIAGNFNKQMSRFL